LTSCSFALLTLPYRQATVTFEFADPRFSFVDGFTAPVTLRRKCASVVPIPRDGKVEIELWLRRDDSSHTGEADGPSKVYVLCKVEAKVRTRACVRACWRLAGSL
jgi:hypothetical protein